MSYYMGYYYYVSHSTEGSYFICPRTEVSYFMYYSTVGSSGCVTVQGLFMLCVTVQWVVLLCVPQFSG